MRARSLLAWLRGSPAPGLLLAALLGAPAGVAGQTVLDRVEALASDGRADEARVLLMEWWEGDRVSAPRDDLQRGIWLRGRLTVDPGQAALEYWRLVVEFPGSPYTTLALQRIGRGAAAAGDTAGAVRAWETLVRDHRGTPEAERARELLEELRAGRLEPTIATEVPEEAEPVEAIDPGVQDTVGPGDSIVTDAAGGEDPTPADTGTAEPTASADESVGGPPEPGELGDFSVQLGAFRSTERARDLVELATRAGLEPRLVRVPESDLLRVRVGRLDTEAEADALRRRVVGLGFDALLVEGARLEDPVGGER